MVLKQSLLTFLFSKVNVIKLMNLCVHGYNGTGCKVSVTCMDERRRVVYHANDETDDQGEFELLVNKYINGKELKHEKGCTVRLVSSPHPNCNIATDFGKGKSGAKLCSPSHVYPGLIKYTIGPFYFTSPMCDDPNTTPPSPN